MPKINLTVPHRLGEDEAKRRIIQKAQSVRDQYGGQVSSIHEEWTGNQLAFGFSAMGIKIAGRMTVAADHVCIDVDVPLMAMMMRGPFERRARQELDELLA